MSTSNRPVANFNPSIWGDMFLNYSLDPHDQGTKEEEAREVEVQVKEQFSVLLSKVSENPLELLSFIDSVERLGVAHRFGALIDESLHAIFNLSSERTTSLEEEDLHLISLRFRLLRQHGFHAPSDVFEILLKDEETRCFKNSLASDVKGMLSLYEASHLRVLHGELILDEALEFARFHLKSQLDASKLSPPLSSLVARSLNIPLHKAMVRLESRHYISIYEQDPMHDKDLLRFAKMEFNLLQSSYKEELMHLSRWWKELDITSQLPFPIRDRVVELYFWGLGALYEPQYSFTRMFFVKTVKLISILDDIYDAYGTIDELEPFHKAIERWDISLAKDLPQYMKLVFGAFINTYKEIEQCLAKEGRSHTIQYVIDEVKAMSQVYLHEARWRHNKYTPTYDEYMNEAAIISFGNNWAIATCFIGVGEVATEEAFKWLRANPLVVIGGGKNGRLMNDMVSRKFERDRWHIPSAVECYMSENGATREETHKEFHAQLEGVWKDINQAMLSPTVVPRVLLGFQLNFDRLVNLVYKDDDGYTFPENTMKDHILCVLVNPIPM